MGRRREGIREIWREREDRQMNKQKEIGRESDREGEGERWRERERGKGRE